MGTLLFLLLRISLTHIYVQYFIFRFGKWNGSSRKSANVFVVAAVAIHVLVSMREFIWSFHSSWRCTVFWCGSIASDRLQKFKSIVVSTLCGFHLFLSCLFLHSTKTKLNNLFYFNGFVHGARSCAPVLVLEKQKKFFFFIFLSTAPSTMCIFSSIYCCCCSSACVDNNPFEYFNDADDDCLW